MAGIEAKDLVLFQWDEDLPEKANLEILEDAVETIRENELRLMKSLDWNGMELNTPIPFHSIPICSFHQR